MVEIQWREEWRGLRRREGRLWVVSGLSLSEDQQDKTRLRGMGESEEERNQVQVQVPRGART